MSYYYDYKPYVTVAQRRAKAQKAAAKLQKSGSASAPITPFSGAVARSFWGKAWCTNLESYSDYANRLPRGRSYLKNGAVIDLRVLAGRVQAQVAGSSVYQVSIAIKPLPEAQWRAVCKDCTGSIDSLVGLLQGELSDAVMARICHRSTGLFPAPAEITLQCSCPDWADMCKHVAAVMYGIGTRLDSKPELLFTLRGVKAKDLVAEAGQNVFAQARAGAADPTGKVSKRRLGATDSTALADVFGLEGLDGSATVEPPALASIAKSPKKPAKTTPAKAAKTAEKVAAKAVRMVPKKAAKTRKATKKVTPATLPTKRAASPKKAAKRVVKLVRAR